MLKVLCHGAGAEEAQPGCGSCHLPLCSLLVQLVKLCSGMIEAGKAYITTNKHFVSGVRDLSQQCKKDEMISVSRPAGQSEY